MTIKRGLVILLLAALVTAVCPAPALAAVGAMRYTEAELEADNGFEPTVHTTLGRGDAGNNNRIAQSFVADGQPVVGCRLHFRLGDNADMTLQIRTSLTGGAESIVYSGVYPLVSDPHNITGWWDFSFTRALQLNAGQTYYLTAWCESFHSYCIVSTTRYVANNLVNQSYRQPENSDEWLPLNRRSFGYELVTDPSATPQGYPYAADDNTFMLHDAEEYYCFARGAANTTLELTGETATQGYNSMRLTPGAPDAAGAVFTAYVDFDRPTDLTRYRYYYLDFYCSEAITAPLTLRFSLLGAAGERSVDTDLEGTGRGWRRLTFRAEEFAPAAASLSAATGVRLTGLAPAALPQGAYFAADNLRACLAPAPSFTDSYYSEEELQAPEELGDDDYIGKPDRTPTTVRYGDIDDNGAINAADALLALRAAVGRYNPAAAAFAAGDVDGNNTLNAVDALWILRRAVRRVDRFPVETAGGDDDPQPTGDFHLSATGLQPNTVYVMPKGCFTRAVEGVMPHDVARLVSSLQGLLNREVATNRVALVIADDYSVTWLPYLQEHSDLLAGMTNTVSITSFDEFLRVFRAQIIECGLLLWDPDVPSTANVAETICGLDGPLPVKYLTGENSLYNRLLALGAKPKLSLVDKFTGKGLIPGTSLLSTGSVKCDPYLWALEKYSARCSSGYLVYTPDGASSTEGNPIYEKDEHSKSLDYNHSFGYDYGIYRRAFFFDLTPIDTEAPCDDPNQIIGTDAATLRAILLNRYYRAGGEFGEVVGFPPWQLKYTTHNNWGSVIDTAVEAAFTSFVTCYNCYMDADGSVADCSLYAQFPLADSYAAPANHKPVTEQYDPNTMYLYLYTGDYDSSGWALQYLYPGYNNPQRGQFPITWSITPGLSNRIPMLFDYLYKNQTDQDYFSSANSGVGYVRPQSLFREESERTLPNGDKAFIRINRRYFNKFDMDSVGFIIGTLSDRVCRTYNQFAPSGSNTNDPGWTPAVYAGTPYVRIKNGIGNPPGGGEVSADSLRDMLSFAQSMRPYGGAGFRTIRFTAGDLKKTQDAFLAYAAEKDPSTTYRFVDYQTYFAMLAASQNGRVILN